MASMLPTQYAKRLCLEGFTCGVKSKLVCEAGPSVGVIPVQLMAAQALLSIKMHAIFIYLFISDDIQLIRPGTITTKNVKRENFKKWNACTSQRKKFQPVLWPATEL